MDDLKELITAEGEIDEMVKNLDVWKLPFQSVITNLLMTIDNIRFNGRPETAMDYASRLSYIYPLVVQRSAKGVPNNTYYSQMATLTFSKDFIFLNAYAHLCMLMPQVHRGIFRVHKIADKHFRLEFADADTEFAEKIDRQYSYLSQELGVQYNMTPLHNHFSAKVASGDWALYRMDYIWLAGLFNHHRKYTSIIRVAPEENFLAAFGFSYDEYCNYCAAVRAYSYFFTCYAEAFLKRALLRGMPKAQANLLMREYFENAVCCHKHVGMEEYIRRSLLKPETFELIHSYFLSLYSNTTSKAIVSNAFCGEAFFPPFIAIDECYLYSSPGSGYMLTLNNLFYSLNKRQEPVFNQHISNQLEPVLIRQIQYLFSHFPGISTRPNVKYVNGEVDLLVLSEDEGICICIQAKATLAPDSGRTISRVQDRTLEGIAQVRAFDALPEDQKLHIINGAFGTNLPAIKLVHLVATRSCVGSGKAWKKDALYQIVNYVFLASVLADKKSAGDFSIVDIVKGIDTAQTELLSKTNAKVVHEILDIGGYKIEFPNVTSDAEYVLNRRINAFTEFPEMERSFF